MDKWILFFIWVVIAMSASTIGLVLILRWYYREVDKIKKQRAAHEEKDEQLEGKEAEKIENNQ